MPAHKTQTNTVVNTVVHISGKVMCKTWSVSTEFNFHQCATNGNNNVQKEGQNTMSFKAAFELSVRTFAWVHVHASVAAGLQGTTDFFSTFQKFNDVSKTVSKVTGGTSCRRSIGRGMSSEYPGKFSPVWYRGTRVKCHCCHLERVTLHRTSPSYSCAATSTLCACLPASSHATRASGFAFYRKHRSTSRIQF